MRAINLGQAPCDAVARSVGMTGREIEDMYRLLAIAKYDDRYVIPSAYAEQGHALEETACSLDFDGGPGMLDSGPFGEASGRPVRDAASPVSTGDGNQYPRYSRCLR